MTKKQQKDPTEAMRLKASKYSDVLEGTSCTQSSFKVGKTATFKDASDSRASDDVKVVKQKAVDLGPTVVMDEERCINCTRCVRFTREVTGTSELMVDGRGAMEQIDVFPGQAIRAAVQN